MIRGCSGISADAQATTGDSIQAAVETAGTGVPGTDIADVLPMVGADLAAAMLGYADQIQAIGQEVSQGERRRRAA